MDNRVVLTDENGNEMSYSSDIEVAVLMEVFSIFKERNADLFDFQD